MPVDAMVLPPKAIVINEDISYPLPTSPPSMVDHVVALPGETQAGVALVISTLIGLLTRWILKRIRR